MEVKGQVMETNNAMDQTAQNARILVLADDFTGACETALPWFDAGWQTSITLDFAGTSPAQIADLDTRYATAEQARERVARALAEADANAMVFKKIDSQWRGNIHAELTALAAAGFHLVIAGALPHLNRTVKGGVPLLDGVPLARTDAWKVETAKAPEKISDLLHGMSTTSLPSPEAAGAQFGALLNDALVHQAVIIDCATEADLDAVAAAWLESREPSVLVGTGALNAALAKIMAQGQPAAPEAAREARPVAGIIGSASGRSGEQLRAAAADGIHVTETAADLGKDFPETPALISAPAAPGDPKTILRTLRNTAQEYLKDHPGSDLFLTGGETARAILNDLSITSLAPLKQLEPGVVICQAPDGRLIGTKPGTFGSTHVLSHALTTLRTLRS